MDKGYFSMPDGFGNMLVISAGPSSFADGRCNTFRTQAQDVRNWSIYVLHRDDFEKNRENIEAARPGILPGIFDSISGFIYAVVFVVLFIIVLFTAAVELCELLYLLVRSVMGKTPEGDGPKPSVPAKILRIVFLAAAFAALICFNEWVSDKDGGPRVRAAETAGEILQREAIYSRPAVEIERVLEDFEAKRMEI